MVHTPLHCISGRQLSLLSTPELVNAVYKQIKMKSVAVILSLALVFDVCLAQFFVQQPIALQLANNHQVVQPHKAVEINAAHEALLPPELLKSKKFYDDPRIAAGLAKDSWFTDKEMPVLEREAEKIPREKIYKLAKDAGFIRRR